MGATPSVRLSGNSPTELQDAVVPKRRRQITQPNPTPYGIFAQALASMLASDPRPGETARWSSEMKLGRNAKQEQERYSRDVAAANAAQLELTNLEGYYDILTEREEALQGDVDRGMGGVRGEPVKNAYGVWTTPTDQTRVDVANANQLNTDQAERFGTYSTAIDTLRKSGVDIPDAYLGELLTPPTQTTPVPLETGTAPLTPGDQTQRYSADEGLTAEQQMEAARIKAEAAADGDDIEVSVTQPTTNGPPQVVYKGNPDALRRRGIDPVTGQKIRPNGASQGGDEAPKPAAETSVKPRPISNARDVYRRLFGREPTEWKRDPNSRLGRANPSSWHNRSGAAIDSKPIKGMTYEQYVQKFRDAGYEIIEDKDEVRNPSRHATGPHWHVVLGEKRDTTQMYATRLRAMPNVAEVVPNADGSILVTTKSGKQMVFKNGKRIG